LFTSDGSVGVIGINFDNATQQVGGISRKIPSVSLSHCRYLDVRAKLDYTLEIGQCNGTHWSYQYLYQSREWNIFTIDLWNPGGAQGASLRLKGEITNIGFKIGDGGWYASPLTSGWKYVKIDYAALRRTTSIEEENAKKLFYQILLIGVGICFLGVYFPFPLLKKSQQPTPTFSNWKSMEERP
jgi:hypothetical protein